MLYEVITGAAQRITDANDAATTVQRLLENAGELAAMRTAAKEFSQAHRGATARTMALIRECIS